MSRPNRTALRVYEMVCTTPGIRPAQIARCLRIPPPTVYRALPALEHISMLLYEDAGRLYPFSAGLDQMENQR